MLASLAGFKVYVMRVAMPPWCLLVFEQVQDLDKIVRRRVCSLVVVVERS
jgi:hypothetical protein